MTEQLAITLINALILLLLLLIQILTPKLVRRNILFGISIPGEKQNDNRIKGMIKNFKRDNMVLGLPLLIIFSCLLYIFPSPIVQMILMFVYMGILFIIYLNYNSKAKQLKREEEWDKIGRKVVVVDMKYSRDKPKRGNISSLWFLIPLIIALLNLVFAFIIYPSLPDKIPTHWDFHGEITTYKAKSYGIVLLLPLTQLGMVGMFYFIFRMIGRVKQQVDPNNPRVSLKRTIIFQKAWSIYLLILLILTVILFSILSLLSYGIIFKTTKMVNIFTLLILIVSIVGGLGLSIKLGQGGERLKLEEDSKEGKVYRKDDDELWKLGNTIYYNPEDSSIFVEKRFGIGWTVNAGRPMGLIFLIIPFIIIILTLIFSI